MPTAPPRSITIVAYPEVQSLDVTGPYEVFAIANRMVTSPPEDSGLTVAPGRPPETPYRIEIVAPPAADRPGAPFGSVRAASGLLLGVDRVLPADGRPRAADRRIDTIVVAGGEGTEAAVRDAALVGWLRHTAPHARRVTSVCSGAFLLAVAGLLDGRRATTHWSECDRLAHHFPRVQVDDDPIFVKDGTVYTSAGVTAGMDLALALVEEDLGREIALQVSRWMVMFVQRPGGQSQFSSQLSAQLAERRPVRELQAYIAEHPEADLSVDALAGRLALSPRHFARIFRDEVGATPAQYVEQARVEVARRLLETTDAAVEQVARRAGFGTVDTMQRAFRRQVHVTPTDYRRHFARPRAIDTRSA